MDSKESTKTAIVRALTDLFEVALTVEDTGERPETNVVNDLLDKLRPLHVLKDGEEALQESFKLLRTIIAQPKSSVIPPLQLRKQLCIPTYGPASFVLWLLTTVHETKDSEVEKLKVFAGLAYFVTLRLVDDDGFGLLESISNLISKKDTSDELVYAALTCWTILRCDKALEKDCVIVSVLALSQDDARPIAVRLHAMAALLGYFPSSVDDMCGSSLWMLRFSEYVHWLAQSIAYEKGVSTEIKQMAALMLNSLIYELQRVPEEFADIFKYMLTLETLMDLANVQCAEIRVGIESLIWMVHGEETVLASVELRLRNAHELRLLVEDVAYSPQLRRYFRMPWGERLYRQVEDRLIRDLEGESSQTQAQRLTILTGVFASTRIDWSKRLDFVDWLLAKTANNETDQQVAMQAIDLLALVTFPPTPLSMGFGESAPVPEENVSQRYERKVHSRLLEIGWSPSLGAEKWRRALQALFKKASRTQPITSRLFHWCLHRVNEVSERSDELPLLLRVIHRFIQTSGALLTLESLCVAPGGLFDTLHESLIRLLTIKDGDWTILACVRLIIDINVQFFTMISAWVDIPRMAFVKAVKGYLLKATNAPYSYPELVIRCELIQAQTRIRMASSIERHPSLATIQTAQGLIDVLINKKHSSALESWYDGQILVAACQSLDLTMHGNSGYSTNNYGEWAMAITRDNHVPLRLIRMLQRSSGDSYGVRVKADILDVLWNIMVQSENMPAEFVDYLVREVISREDDETKPLIRWIVQDVVCSDVCSPELKVAAIRFITRGLTSQRAMNAENVRKAWATQVDSDLHIRLIEYLRRMVKNRRLGPELRALGISLGFLVPNPELNDGGNYEIVKDMVDWVIEVQTELSLYEAMDTICSLMNDTVLTGGQVYACTRQFRSFLLDHCLKGDFRSHGGLLRQVLAFSSGDVAVEENAVYIKFLVECSILRELPDEVTERARWIKDLAFLAVGTLHALYTRAGRPELLQLVQSTVLSFWPLLNELRFRIVEAPSPVRATAASLLKGIFMNLEGKEKQDMIVFLIQCIRMEPRYVARSSFGYDWTPDNSTANLAQSILTSWSWDADVVRAYEWKLAMCQESVLRKKKKKKETEPSSLAMLPSDLVQLLWKFVEPTKGFSQWDFNLPQGQALGGNSYSFPLDNSSSINGGTGIASNGFSFGDATFGDGGFNWGNGGGFSWGGSDTTNMASSWSGGFTWGGSETTTAATSTSENWSAAGTGSTTGFTWGGGSATGNGGTGFGSEFNFSIEGGTGFSGFTWGGDSTTENAGTGSSSGFHFSIEGGTGFTWGGGTAPGETISKNTDTRGGGGSGSFSTGFKSGDNTTTSSNGGTGTNTATGFTWGATSTNELGAGGSTSGADPVQRTQVSQMIPSPNADDDEDV